MSNHFKKERRGSMNVAQASGDVLYQEFKKPVNSRAGNVRSVAGGLF